MKLRINGRDALTNPFIVGNMEFTSGYGLIVEPGTNNYNLGYYNNDVWLTGRNASYGVMIGVNGTAKWRFMPTTFAFQAQADALAIAAKDTDTNYLQFQARDSGVGLVGVARLVGAADPFMCFTGVVATIPTNANLPIGWWAIGYVSGANATLYVNDAGTVKSLVLGAPA